MTKNLGARLNTDALHPIEGLYLRSWGIDSQSHIVPPLEPGQRNFLLWHGQYDSMGQTPVFAVAVRTPRNIIFPNNLQNWVYGIGRQELIVAESDTLGAMLDAATFPAETLRLALGQLACILPIEQLATR